MPSSVVLLLAITLAVSIVLLFVLDWRLALVALGAQTLEDAELMTLQFLNASRAVGAPQVVWAPA